MTDDTDQFRVSADVLDPEDGEAGIIAQARVGDEWRVAVLSRFFDVRTAKQALRRRLAEYESAGRVALAKGLRDEREEQRARADALAIELAGERVRHRLTIDHADSMAAALSARGTAFQVRQMAEAARTAADHLLAAVDEWVEAGTEQATLAGCKLMDIAEMERDALGRLATAGLPPTLPPAPPRQPSTTGPYVVMDKDAAP